MSKLKEFRNACDGISFVLLGCVILLLVLKYVGFDFEVLNNILKLIK